MIKSPGLYLSAFRRAFLSPSKAFTSYSQCGEDAVLAHLLSIYDGPRLYVDVGCHHPRRGSNTYAFYRKGWRGVLIDLEEEKLLACRLARPRDKTVCAAVSNTERVVDLHMDKSFSTLTSINPEIVRSRNLSFVRQMKTQTLQSILDDLSFSKVFGLLSVDVEGEDAAVLMGLNLDVYQPALICVEELDNYGQNGRISDYLAGHGYRNVSKAGSSVIYRRNSLLGLSQMTRSPVLAPEKGV